ncbi:MAG: hypothetical protein DWI21_11935 [Planctomycetota bacterium]|nr:MAG: hypothetical protein DWI21_11935 [Planctomycetota bacterium]
MTYKHFLLFLILFVPAVGCSGGSSGFKGVDVSGTVLIDGKPLEGVEVYFFTDQFEGFGKTNTEGKYQLVSGAAPGPNKIYFKKFNPDAVSGIDMSIPGMDAGQAAAMAEAKAAESGGKKKATSLSLVPPEYSDPKTTKLSFPVPAAGTSSADFKISSK